MHFRAIMILLIIILAESNAIDDSSPSLREKRISFFEEPYNPMIDIRNENKGKSDNKIKFEDETPSKYGFKFVDAENYKANESYNKIENLNDKPIQNNHKNYKIEAVNYQNFENSIAFHDSNKIQKSKRKRRRRHPRQQLQGYGMPQGLPPGSPGYPGFNPDFYRPPMHRPRPDLAEDALTSITSALASIARYDDFQCVPRLLCEVASGKETGGLQENGVLNKFVDLQPLITLIAAYSGLHTSPAFFFGRSILLGITSKGKPDLCYEAYPLCPSDPEKLVHYLNNHNGGFFRFFNNPQQGHQEQNVEQFLGHLSNIPHSYGFYRPGFQGYGLQGLEGQQNYGQLSNGQQYGLQNAGLQNGIAQQNHGFPSKGPQNFGLQQSNQQNNALVPNPSDYNEMQQQYLYQKRYGYGYAKQNSAKSNSQDNVTNKIQRRIQVKPEADYDTNASTKNDKSVWTFPENSRQGGKLNFPNKGARVQANTAKVLKFPERQSNRHYIDYYNYPPLVDYQSKLPNYEVVENVDEEDFQDSSKVNNNANNENGDVELVYVIRGNGDPYNPEVVKLRPGQKLQL